MGVVTGAPEQAIVRRQKHIHGAELGTGQVKRVERAKPESLEKRGASSFGWTRNDGIIRICKQRCHVVATVRVRVSADLDFQHRAAHQCGSALAYHPKDVFDRLCLVPYAGLALVVGQTVQATGIQVQSQSRPIPWVSVPSSA